MKSIGFYLPDHGTVWLSFYCEPILDDAELSLHNMESGQVACCSKHYTEFLQLRRGDIPALRRFYERRVTQLKPDPIDQMATIAL